MLLTQPIVRPSYSFSTLLRSLAAAKLIVDAGPTAIPPSTAPAAAAESVGADATRRAEVIPRPARLSSRLGSPVRSHTLPPPPAAHPPTTTILAPPTPPTAPPSPPP